MADTRRIPNGIKFLLGGLAGMGATAIIQPFDLVKTRMQISGAGAGAGAVHKEYKNSFHCLMAVIKNEGVFALYAGLDAGLLRQATYTTARLGVYTWLIDWHRSKYDRNTSTVAASMAMGVVSGAIGAFVGTPADMALIRMMADKKQPEMERRNYKNVIDALSRVVREEGLFALWRGCLPTVMRAMVLNMTQLASYSQFKVYFRDGPLQMSESIVLHLVASMGSGLLTTITTMPLDMAKTRIQNMKTIGGQSEYNGMLDVIVRVATNEGVFALWKGFTPYLLRIGPHTVLTFIFLEQLQNLYVKIVKDK